jgi:hypothetical protein
MSFRSFLPWVVSTAALWGACSTTMQGPGGAGGASGTGGAGGAGGTGGASGTGGAGGNRAGGRMVEAGLPAGVGNLFPPPGGQNVCPDPPLRITFAGPPTLGAAGKVQVFNAAGAVVASVDMAAATVTDTIGGTSFSLLRPVYVDGNDAVVYLKTKALGYGQTYYVNVDAGAIDPPGGAALAIGDGTTWRFSTAAAAPADLSSLTVALDGTGDFCSVQGATDALPANSSAAATITIAAGTYHEIVHFRSKNNVTLHGQDRQATVIAGTNNDDMNPGTANRALVGIDDSNGLVVENLTIHNLTPQGGSQAEALRLQACDQCVVRDADILSLQDTLLWSGRVYADNCYIAGNVDFVWGTGAAYFNKCELHTVGRAGAIVQARNPASTYGYVFVDSQLTADAGVTGQVLARVDVSVYPASHVAYVNWTATNAADTSMLRFWEYQSVDPTGNPIDVSQRLPASRQLTAAQAAMMRDPTVVLAGWQPPP